MYEHSFSAVESNAEFPLLPCYFIPVDIEGWALWLLHDVWLQVCPYRLSEQVMGVLDGFNRLPRLSWRGRGIRSTWEIIHPHKLMGESIKHRRELARCRVVIVLRVIRSNNVHITLEKPTRFPWIITAVYPRVVAHRHACWELELRDLLLDSRMRKTKLFNRKQLVCINRSLLVRKVFAKEK